MELKEKEFFEYIKCPLRYQLIKKGHTLEEQKTFNQICYEVINSNINARVNGMKSDFNTFKRKWDSLAKENEFYLGAKKILDGWGYVYRTFEYIEMFNIKFLDCNTSYKIEIPGTQVCLTGVLNPIIDRGTYIEVFVPHFNRSLPERIEIDTKLKHTIDAYAIKQMFKKDAVFTYYSPATGKTIETIRSTRDFKKLESMLTMVSKAINANIIYPRETFMCSSCVAREMCKSWTGQEEV